jgi:hypothetical protein
LVSICSQNIERCLKIYLKKFGLHLMVSGNGIFLGKGVRDFNKK